jgi:hypothetical protein
MKLIHLVGADLGSVFNFTFYYDTSNQTDFNCYQDFHIDTNSYYFNIF